MRSHLVTTVPSQKATAKRAPTWVERAGQALLRSGRLARPKLTREDVLFIASLYIVTRVLIVFLGLVGAAMFPNVLPDRSFLVQPPGAPGVDLWRRLFVHFDGQWYINISHGYPSPSSGDQQWLLYWAFFPLYPILLHPVGLLLGTAGVLDPDPIAGVIVSHLALFAALLYVYQLASAELSVPAARRAVTYVLIFPASIFFSAVYTESLFLLVSVAAFYYARSRQWALASVFAALALLTRAQGLFLLLPLALEFVSDAAERQRREGRAIDWSLLRGLWLGTPLLALGGYALYSRTVTGYWLAFSTSAAQFWGKRLTPPVYPLIRYVLAPDLGSTFNFDFRSVNFAAALLFLGLVVVTWRRLPPAYSVWLLVCILFPLSTNGHYFFSFTRYVSTAFPAFLALAAWSLGQRWTPEGVAIDAAGRRTLPLELRDRLIVIPSLLLLALFTVMFVNGIYAAI